ncbi:uncharacterized protein NPIL_445861 [Nephila pilipes]|uniref:Retrovirus-related Pol polyprotein from transposon TNT 1-94 n=1 Tax=Nephila pilipes TaxID=299642 RepID=A0A8X6QZK8_NEPPI|nr:uncharacterized protein NPIL_445861 [Nephila pilipes]
MEKKAIQGYLVGYEEDELYQICLKKEHRVNLSRDVIFQGKASRCDDHAELKLEDRQKSKLFEDHIMVEESYLEDNNNPQTYEEAINSKDSTNWKKAKKSEMNYLSENHIWDLTDLPVEDKASILRCYSDSDFRGCTKTSKSTSGYVMVYAGGTISWNSQRQAMVSTSTTEAEVIAALEVAKEVIWLCRLIQGIAD